MDTDILGKKVREKVSGLEGTAMSVTVYLNGCRRISVQRKLDKDGKLPEEVWFDHQQIEVIDEKKVIESKTATGGPQTTRTLCPRN